MNAKSGLYRLVGKIRNYEWGGYTFLPRLLGGEEPSRLPCAEYWLGAHHQAPSQILREDGAPLSLSEVIADQPEKVLGREVYRNYGRLPFLLKVLDVNEPLSIQVHPSKPDAEAGFQRENDLGIPLDSPLRNYRDDNHKPELMVALSDFWLLHGFLPAERLVAALNRIPELRGLKPHFESGGYFGLYQHVMELPQQCVKAITVPLLSRLVNGYHAGRLRKSSPHYWSARIAASSPARHFDPGLLCIYFLNLLHLKKGEAIFQDAGIPHAYLQGQNIEIMANSDNVLRGGLTNKHVDPQELMKRTRFERINPHTLQRKVIGRSPEGYYESPARDFALSDIHLRPGDRYEHTTCSLEILINLKGEARVTASGGCLILRKGQSAVVFSRQRYKVEGLTGSVSLFRASVPRRQS